MADETMLYLSPGDVAKRLRVSPSGLRRLAMIYGEVHGDLPKDSGGTSRLWPMEAVVRLEAARALMAAGQARSIRDALEAVAQGAEPTEIALEDRRVAEALGVVAAQLEALRDDLREIPALRAEVESLRAELGRQQGAQRPTAIPSASSTLRPTSFDGPAEAKAPGATRASRKGGVLVRLAWRLERILRRGNE